MAAENSGTSRLSFASYLRFNEAAAHGRGKLEHEPILPQKGRASMRPRRMAAENARRAAQGLTELNELQ